MSSRTDHRRWVRIALPVILLVMAMATVATVGLSSTAGEGSPSTRLTFPGVDLTAATTVASASPTTTAPTTTALTMAQWKQLYQQVITRLANDALAVVKAGAGTSSTDQSKVAAQAKKTLAACNSWRRDSGLALGLAPAIPSAAAQATWRQLAGASGRAASACTRALTKRNPTAAKDFRTALATVYRAEGRLATELNGVG
jgi:hypothetical protein